MNTVTALSALIIGISGGDNVTLQHLDHLINWEGQPDKQLTLTAAAPKTRDVRTAIIGQPYRKNPDGAITYINPVDVTAPSATPAPAGPGNSNLHTSPEAGHTHSLAQADTPDEDTDKILNIGIAELMPDGIDNTSDNDTVTYYPAADDNTSTSTENPLKNYSKNQTVYFWINEPTTVYKVRYPTLDKTKPVYLLGYASPDGESPRLQIDLANKRAVYIQQRLLQTGYNAIIAGAALCSRCWQVELYQ
jgi:hypothetical protein